MSGSYSLQQRLNELAETDGLAPDAAANAWAGTEGLSLVGALNAKAGTSGHALQLVCNEIAGTDGLAPVAALEQATSDEEEGLGAGFFNPTFGETF